MTMHGCMTWPCPICTQGATSSVTTTGGTWNGAICFTCGACYLGTHQCDAAALLRKAAELTEMARRLQQPTPVDRTASCPCRPENGGSGVCGCVLSGPQITCSVSD